MANKKTVENERVDLGAIRCAAGLLRGQIVDTPCVASQTLSAITGARVTLKLENLQFTGSFKDRGALVRLSALTPHERRRGVIAMSAGNHAQAVAYHAQRLGVPAVIVMPAATPNIKVSHTRSFGAEVVLHGESLSESAAEAERIATERDLVFIHPYDDPAVIAGQGTIGLEILEQAPETELLVVPIGGGGLVSGIAIAVKALRPEVRVIGVETSGYASMLGSLKGREPQFARSTLAEGIAVKQPGRITRRIVGRLVERILLVDDPEIEDAVLLLLEVEKTVAEGAGAVPLAALRRYPDLFASRRVTLVISGGNIDLPVLSSIIQRGLVRSGRLARLSVAVPDRPGELAKVADLIGKKGGNIVQALHQRIFTELPLQSTEIQFVLQTRGPEHLLEITAWLAAAGYGVQGPSNTDPVVTRLPLRDQVGEG
jgi:threonine dehydratase